MRDEVFRDRGEAGQALAAELGRRLGDRDDLIVLALPRGGVPIGYEIASALGAPLDVLIVRKLGLPGQEELAMGAIASGGARVLNDEVVGSLRVPDEWIERVARRELHELERRELLYRGDLPQLDVRGKTVVVVDDGLATGSTMRVAVQALRKMGPRRIVVAVPVAAASTCRSIGREADEIVCLRTPEPFEAVGLWYEDFSQTTDREVHELLARARDERRDDC
ncbi:MAG TPA: phosphoribosyltransferase [Thermoanaerobaculia bacterium]